MSARRWPLILAALLIPATASADRRFDKLLERGVRCYQELNYGCALGRLGDASTLLEGGLEVDRADAMTLHETLAFVLASVERHADAASAFERCFALNPTYKLDPKVISPKIYVDYKAARRTSLRALMKGERRAPKLPTPFGPRPPGLSDYRLHIPARVMVGGRVEPRESLVHHVDVRAGARLLFDDDAERYGPGFGLAFIYSYSVTEILRFGVAALFSQHAYTLDDLKAGFPGTLYVLDVGPGLWAVFQLGDYVDLDLGIVAGIGLSGLGTLGEATGGWIGGSVGVTITPSPEFGIGLSAIPSVVIAGLSAGDTGTSFSLPLLLRFEARF